MQTITGELRKWQRRSMSSVEGYVYYSDIWDDGEYASFVGGSFVESSNFFLYVLGKQVYKLDKDEQIKTP